MYTYIHREARERTPCTHKHTHINTQHESIHAWHVETHTHLHPAAFHPCSRQQRDEACSKWPCSCPSTMVAAAIEPDEGVQSAHQWMRECQAVPGKIIQPPVAPTQPHHTQLPDTFLDQRVMPVCPGHLAKYSTHLTSVYSHRNPGEELSAVCNSSLLLQQHRRLCPLRTLDTKRAPKGAHVAQLLALAPLQSTPWHMQLSHGQPGHPTFSSPALPRVCLGPHPMTRAEKDITSGCCFLLSRKISEKVFPSSHGDYLRFDGVSSIAALHPSPQPQSVSENVYLCVVTNFCLPGSISDNKSKSYHWDLHNQVQFSPVAEKAFCTTFAFMQDLP